MADKIKYLVMDVDGTLTDGKIYMGTSGEILKAFDIKDGYGIHDMLIPYGITPVIITGRSSKILENRCRELSITDLFQGIKDKIDVLKQYLCSNNSSLQEVAYIGDDLNDLPCMKLVKEAGGIFLDGIGNEFTYNRKDVYNQNGYSMFNCKENKELRLK